jgi:hypothetical protein
MRPDRAIVQQAIRDSEGNLTRAAAILGCSRQTLYTWVYQLGLEKLAGIRIDTRDALDRRGALDTPAGTVGRKIKTGVYSDAAEVSNLHAVATPVTSEPYIPATVKLPESLWKRIRAKAIYRGCTAAVIVQEALEVSLASEDAADKKASGRR